LSQQDITQSTRTGVSNTFTHDFAPLSMTVLTFNAAAPGEPILSVPAQAVADEFVLELSGDAGFTYVIERTSDFTSWYSVSTNTLSSGSAQITNSVSPGTSYELWRAVWYP
jgi:hypothetical protein